MKRAGLVLGHALLIGVFFGGESTAADCPGLLPKATAIEPVFDSRGAWSESTRVWLLSDSCTIGVVTLERSGDQLSCFTDGKGVARPLLAPDGRWFTYAAGETLFMCDIANSSWTLAFVGNHRHHQRVSGWSPDATRLLFYSKPNECGDCPPIEDPDPAFWLYDPDSKQVQRSALTPTAQFVDWMDPDTLLVELPGEQYLSTFSISTGESSPTKVRAGYKQPAFRPGTNSVIGTSRAGIVQASILTGVESILWAGPEDWWVSSPRPSPSGKRVAFWLETPPHGAVVVDGSVVAEYEVQPRFAWLNESLIIIDWNKNIQVIDATTGKPAYRIGD